MNIIISHMKTDINTVKHCRLALLANMIVLGIPMTAIALCVGVAIELVQFVTRLVTGSEQNTLKEAMLDIAGTTLFTWFYFKQMYNK